MNNLIFKRENFNTPKTVRINHPEGAKWALGELDADFPLILKTAAGSRGIGVMWIESEKALHGLVQLLYREDEYIDILIQEYIKTDYDVRVIVCAGKILGAIKRPIVDGDFRSNVSQGSEPELHELTEIEASESIRAADAVGGLLTGVDFIPAKNREKDKPYFIEVNSTPGLMGIESTLSGAAAKPLGKKLKKEGSSITTEILTRFLDRKHWVKK
jgi:RimK family alpha-L-glutamate ligase